MLTQRKVLLGWIFIYVIFTLYQFIFTKIRVFDYIVYILFMLVLFIYLPKVMKYLPINGFHIALFGLIPLFHSIGIIPITYAGKITSLYGGSFFGGNYDLLTHFLGFFVITILVLDIAHKFGIKRKSHKLLICGLIVLSIIGIGTLVECIEFAGYRLFGFGWGLFQFGEGDNSMNFGPWGDSMTDTYANIAGIIVAMLFYGVIAYMHTSRQSKSQKKAKHI